MGSLYEEYEDYVKRYQAEYGLKTIVLYRCGSFYEIYAINDGLVNIKEISELLNIQVSRRNKSSLEVDRSNCNMAGFPMFALKKFVNLLIEAGYTVVIVDQVTSPPKPKRAVTEIISPGTNIDQITTPYSSMLLVAYFEEHSVWRNDTQKLLAIGVSLIDLTTGRSKVTEFASTSQDPFLSLDSLYKLISWYLPKEIIFLSNEPLQNNIDQMKTYLEISETVCVHNKLGFLPDVFQKPFYQEQLLKRVYPKQGLLTIFEYLEIEKFQLATVAFTYMLEFSQRHNENITNNILPPEILTYGDHNLLISYNTCRQLNITTQSTSLISVLNTCVTAIGKRNYKERLLNATTCPTKLQNSYDTIESFLDIHEDIVKQLSNVYDLERLHRRLILKKLHPADFVQIDQTLSTLVSLVNSHCITQSICKSFDLQRVQKFIDEYTTTLDMMEVPKYHQDNIQTNFFLRGVETDIDILQDRLTHSKSFFEVLARNIHMEFCKVDFNERGGYFITITSKRYTDIKHGLKGKSFNVYEHVISFDNLNAKPVSASSSVLKLSDCSSSKIMRHMNIIIQETQQELCEKVLTRYLEFLDTLIKTYDDIFQPCINFISDLDWFASCAKNAKVFRYTRPILANTYNDRSYVQAKSLRHPIIERILNQNSQVSYVSNDITLGTNDVSGILLYGINSAGKSSISKAIGLIIIMAQAGMYVPCDELLFWPYHEIFTRIPSGDDLLKGQSTFVVEISELRNILKRATKHSLVIGDELASGTESVSALAIVSAGILQLQEKQSSFIFATHLHDLTQISHIKKLNTVAIYHMSVAYDPQTDKLIYSRKLQPGQGSSLYGLEVCKSLNLGDAFLKLANEIRQEVLHINPQFTLGKKSRYNSKILVDICSICKKPAEEVHHIQQQSTADRAGYVGHIHKDATCNLMAVCANCHDKIHGGDLIIKGYFQTSDGIEIITETLSSDTTTKMTDEDLTKQVLYYTQQGWPQKAIVEQLKITKYKLSKILSSAR